MFFGSDDDEWPWPVNPDASVPDPDQDAVVPGPGESARVHQPVTETQERAWLQGEVNVWVDRDSGLVHANHQGRHALALTARRAMDLLPGLA